MDEADILLLRYVPLNITPGQANVSQIVGALEGKRRSHDYQQLMNSFENFSDEANV